MPVITVEIRQVRQEEPGLPDFLLARITSDVQPGTWYNYQLPSRPPSTFAYLEHLVYDLTFNSGQAQLNYGLTWIDNVDPKRVGKLLIKGVNGEIKQRRKGRGIGASFYAWYPPMPPPPQPFWRKRR